MVRVAKKPDPRRISELKRKIHTEAYLKAAIDRIAIVLTHEIVGRID